MEEVIQSILTFAAANESTQTKWEDIANNIKARLTSLEEYVGGEFESAIDIYPTLMIAVKEMLESIKVHLQRIESIAHNVETNEEE
eukprot:14713833-Ditylum_brightwellii.AAC.1